VAELAAPLVLALAAPHLLLAIARRARLVAFVLMSPTAHTQGISSE